jgi:hypothetical protein
MRTKGGEERQQEKENEKGGISMARKKQGSIVTKGNKYYAVVAIGSKRKWIKGGVYKHSSLSDRFLND